MKKIPLSELEKVVTADLLRTNYTPRRIESYRKTWNELEKYMKRKDIDEFNMNVGLSFLKEVYGITEFHHIKAISNQLRVRAINMLGEYQVHGHVLSKMVWKIHKYPQFAEAAFSKFIDELKVKGRAKSTIDGFKVFLLRFVEVCESLNVTELKNLDPSIVIKFINTLAGHEKCRVHSELCKLRALLRFLGENDFADKNLLCVVPKFSWDKKSKVPSSYSPQEVEKLLNSIDRGNPKGKRDYAMLLLAAVMGLRAGEICNLQFSNINWTTNELTFQQTKTKKSILLPLLPDVGNAIIDYLQNGRPISDSSAVFLRHICPIGPLIKSTLHSIVTHYMELAGISIPKGKKHGPHALRHSLATALLEANIPLPVISEILGHDSSETTSIYLKIDIRHLRECALDFEFISIQEVG
jgi:integrase/recombinase XerD